MSLRQVGFFAGVGGLEIAGKAAGCEVVAAANHWPLAVQVHAANHPDVVHYCEDLTTHFDPESEEIKKFDHYKLPQFDLLTAGVACQGHSRGGRHGRKVSKKVAAEHAKLRATAWAVTECLEVCRPRFFIVENVVEFLDWTLLEPWLESLRKLGYNVTTQVLHAKRWGVPQDRVRVFFIGHHEGAPIAVSDEDAPELLGLKSREVPGVEQCFDPTIGGWKPISKVRHTPSDKGYKTAREKVEYANERLGGALGWGQHTNYGRWGCSMKDPAPTLTTKPAMLWWVRDGMYRLWQRPELLAAMTMARDYDLLGSKKEPEAKLIGNAVPIKLGQGVIEAVKRAA